MWVSTTEGVKAFTLKQVEEFKAAYGYDFEIEIETVAYEMLDDHIGYIMVSEFEEKTYGQYEEALKAKARANVTFDMLAEKYVEMYDAQKNNYQNCMIRL